MDHRAAPRRARIYGHTTRWTMHLQTTRKEGVRTISPAKYPAKASDAMHAVSTRTTVYDDRTASDMMMKNTTAAAMASSHSSLPPGVALERGRLFDEIYPAVEHIHARIGSGQTPQTPPGEEADPAAMRDGKAPQHGIDAA